MDFVFQFFKNVCKNNKYDINMNFRFPLNKLKPIAQRSPHKGQIYVFITGTNSLSGLGLANCIGCVCEKDMPARNINKYGFKGKPDKLLFTAEVGQEEIEMLHFH